MKRQVFVVWFVIFLVWAFYRAYLFFPEWIEEFFIKPAIFVAPIFYLIVIREKKNLAELGLAPRPKPLFLDIYLGVVIGILFALEGLLANFIKYGKFSFIPILALDTSGGIILFLVINLTSSIWEEILGRGYMYKRLFKVTNNQLWASVVSSFLFLLLHLPIMFTRLHLMGISLLVYPVSIMLLGITNSYLFTLRGSLALPILIHTFWNMTVALYL